MSDDSTVFRKTEKGRAEIVATGRTLDRRLRPILILVDGQVNVGRLLALTHRFGGRREDFEDLVAMGMIEAVPQEAGPGVGVAPPAEERGAYERFAQGQRYLNETVSDKLGIKATFFILRIARCGSAEELRALLPEFEALLARKFDSVYAHHCRQVAETILSP
jgi:hypothetical protein